MSTYLNTIAPETLFPERKRIAKGLATFLVAMSVMAVFAAEVRTSAPKSEGRRYVELNHAIKPDMVTYPGLSEVSLFNAGERFPNGAYVDGIRMLGITGTYIDAPFHGDAARHTIADYPLEKLVNLPTVVVKKPSGRRTFEVADFRGLSLKGKAVLLNSGHDQFFGTLAYGQTPPYLALDAAKFLVEKGVVFVGIDAALIDDMEKNETIPVHHYLLEHGVVICEDMTNLAAMPSQGAFLTAVPPRVPMGSFPARVFATVYGQSQ